MRYIKHKVEDVLKEVKRDAYDDTMGELEIKHKGEEFSEGYGLAILDITEEGIEALRNGGILVGDVLSEYVVAVRLRETTESS